MGQEAPAMRHTQTAKPDMVAFAEGVHVIASAGPDVAERSREPRLLAHEVFRCGELHVGYIALKGRHGQSCPFGDRRIICEIRTLLRGAAVRIEDASEFEGLRRLRDTQARSLGCRRDVTVVDDLLDGV